MNTTTKIKLTLDEHFIIRNFYSRIPQYVLLWICSIALACILGYMPVEQPVTDYAGMRSFSVAFITIAVTTITFAIPTCMRTIFAAYDQYYSTKIREILLMRFPVTLLAISAFTSLIVSLLIVSGIIGITIPVYPPVVFYISAFWTMVCIVYLFLAIEKLIYFVVKAPYAVLDKLEYELNAYSVIKTKEDYDEFRREIASMNDIAATIIDKSTGQDEAIIKVLNFFREIHLNYLRQMSEGNEKLQTNACRAVNHEIVRIFRIAASAKNEQASRNILRIYCQMIVDAMDEKSGIWYFTDMLSQLERMQSYADASAVGEIKSLAYTHWFFMLANAASEKCDDTRKYTDIVRELSQALRKATVNNSDETISKFMRIASNSEIDYDLATMDSAWKIMLDRAVFVYTTWLIDSEPANVETYLDYIKKYSSVATDVFRKVLPDSYERIKALLLYESIANQLSEDSNPSETVAKSTSNKKVVLAMSMHQEDTAASTITALIMLMCSNMNIDDLDDFGRAGLQVKNNIINLFSRLDDDNVARRLDLAERVMPGIINTIGSFHEQQD